MPNTLAHLGAQGPLSRGILGGVDPRWVATGCVLPDLPWIGQRALLMLGTEPNVYDLRLYTAVQASVFFTLVLCGVLALVARRHWMVLLVLSANSLAHLVLDGLQTKWANGVHLLAPFSWSLWSADLFWPEHPVTVGLTAAGVAWAAWELRRSGEPAESTAIFRVSPGRAAAAAVLFVAYLAGPWAFLDEMQETDAHFVDTLRDRDERTGRYVEFDRVTLRTEPDTVLQTFAGEVAATRVGHEAAGTVSVRGRFVTPDTVAVEDLHAHWPTFREGSSMGGLLVVVGLWLLGGRGTIAPGPSGRAASRSRDGEQGASPEGCGRGSVDVGDG